MTREEAIKTIERKANQAYDAINSQALVAALEALGLIKFKEAKEQNPDFIIPVDNSSTYKYFRTDLKELNEVLGKNGYKVTKI